MPSFAAPDALTVDLSTLRRRHIDHHEIATELPVPWLAAVLASTDAEVAAAGRLDLSLHLQPRGVVVATGTLEVAFHVPCGRCLAPSPVEEAARIVATYVPAAAANAARAETRVDADDDEDGLGLSGDELDTWPYEGAVLSLQAMVSEHVKVAYPMRILCERGEDCRGLCSNCGADLNQQAPTGLTCESCGRAVPRTPVAEAGVGDGGAHAASADSALQGEDAPESPLAAALKKLMT